MSRYTESQAKAAKKYLSGLSEIKIRLKPDEKRLIESYAAERGQSVNQYVKEAAIMHGQPQPKPKEQEQPTISTQDKPQPPDDIRNQGGNALVMWLLEHGYNDEEIRAIYTGI